MVKCNLFLVEYYTVKMNIIRYHLWLTSVALKLLPKIKNLLKTPQNFYYLNFKYYFQIYFYVKVKFLQLIIKDIQALKELLLWKIELGIVSKLKFFKHYWANKDLVMMCCFCYVIQETF